MSDGAGHGVVVASGQTITGFRRLEMALHSFLSNGVQVTAFGFLVCTSGWQP